MRNFRADADKTIIEVPNMPNLNGLVELANRDGVDIRPTLLRVVTDLYVQKPLHSPEEEKHFTELALRLIDLVDARTRSIVAQKIGGYPTAPAAVRQRLLRDYIKVTDAVAKSAPEPAPQSAPKAETKSAAENLTAPKPSTADKPAVPGKPSAAHELSELFFAASTEERRLILLNLPYAPLRPATTIPAAIASESVHRLEAAALGHNGEVFARELERTLAISRAQARRLIDDPSGEPIVVAAVALGMPATVLQRILLCLNPAVSQSVQRVYELALLHEEIGPDAALRMLAIWQASHPAQKAAPPAHQPQLWQSEREAVTPPPARPKIRWEDHAETRSAESA